VDFSRRTLLGAVLAALAAAPVPGTARTAEAQSLIDAFKERVVGFDVLALARTILTEARLTKWIPEVEALIGDREHHRGLRSVMEWGQDPAYGAAVSSLIADMSHDLWTKLAIRRLAKRAPATRDAQRAFLDHVVTDWFGVDLEAMRTATAELPDGLLIAVGPPTNLWEVVFSLVKEAFVRYLELVHGRRATVWTSQVDPKRQLLEAILDPANRVVVFLGHGHWNGFSLNGLTGDPADVFDRICRNLRESPREYVPAVLGNDARRAAKGVGYARDQLDEPQLARFVEQVGLSEPKDLVIRHTCGHARYVAEGGWLLWEMIPEDLEPAPIVWGDGLSGAVPEDQGRWEVPFEGWLADKHVELTEQPALGTCLVASPEDTRGYEGDSWFPHFVETPIPAFREPYPWGRATVADPGPEEAAAEASSAVRAEP
jgi:hypothetical protein